LIWLLAAIALRFAFLGSEGLWLDEGYTAWIAHLTPAERAAAYTHDDAPPLYYAIQSTIVPNLPPGEASVRLLSAVVGVAGVLWLVLFPPYAVGAEVSLAFLATGTYGVFYARQARSYSLLFLWELILITSVARFLKGDRRWLIGVALAEGLALYTHNVSATLVVSANLAWLLCGRRDPGRWLASQAAVLVLWLPGLLRALQQLSVHASMNSWIAGLWKETPLALAPLLSLGAMTSGTAIASTAQAGLWSYRGPGSGLLTVIALATVALLLAFSFRKPTRNAAILAASFTLGPLLALTLLSALTSPTYILGRTDSIAYAGFVIWCAIGFGNLPGKIRWGAAGALGLITALALAGSFPVGARAHSNDRKIGNAVRAQSRPGDWVCFVGLSRPSIDYYLSAGRPGVGGDERRRLHYPGVFGLNPAGDRPTPSDSLVAWEAEAYRLRDRLETSGAPALTYVGPIQPGAPAACTAEDLPYPGSMLAYVLNGLRPLAPILRVHGDRVGVGWIAFRIERDRLIPRTELREIEAQP
jgi:hypothetical protein